LRPESKNPTRVQRAGVNHQHPTEEPVMNHRQHEEARRKRRIADVQSAMGRLGLPRDDELFAAWYVDEGRSDGHRDAYNAFCAPVDGVSPKDRVLRLDRIEKVTRRAHMNMITDPWARNFATWYVDTGRTDPLLGAWDEWRAVRFAREAS
jgi:hypothetical protein